MNKYIYILKMPKIVSIGIDTKELKYEAISYHTNRSEALNAKEEWISSEINDHTLHSDGSNYDIMCRQLAEKNKTIRLINGQQLAVKLVKIVKKKIS